MLTRRLPLPSQSFLLLGPRGTGKSTWLRRDLADALWYDLLVERQWLRLTREPGLLTREVEGAPAGTWVVLDEVQRLPRLLDEVQDLLTRRPGHARFALSGSSARKLHRSGANLLPGRIVNRHFFPLVAAELPMEALAPERLLRWGGLPAVVTCNDDRARGDLLDAYVENYLVQELRAEAVVRGIEPFVRFLTVAARMAGQVVNVSSLARDAAVPRPTALSFFEILCDTLLGAWLPAWQPRARVKETQHPKFYFFDPGVTRAAGGRTREPLDSQERGPLLESWVRHELAAWIDLSGCGGSLAYWRTQSALEVDFVWTRGRRAVGFEVKASERWRTEDGAGLLALLDSGAIQRGLGVFLGERAQRIGDLDVLPLAEFAARLGTGEILPG
jgi:predicted AAA+ superfamily ATPase